MRCHIGKYIFVSISAFLFLTPYLHTQSLTSEEPYWHFLVGGSYTLVGRASDDGNPRNSFDHRPKVRPVLGLGYRHPFPRSGSGELRLTYSSQKGSFRTASGGRLFGQRNRFDMVTDWLHLSYLFSYQTSTMVGLQAGLVVTFPFNESLLGNLSLSYQFAENNRGSAFFLGESMQVHAFMLTLGVQTDL